MPRRSDTSLATLLLVARVVPAEARPLSAREFWHLVETIGDPAALLGLPEAALGERLGPDTAGRVAALFDRATALALEIERLEQAGIVTIAALDDDYPDRLRTVLGDQAPAVLHAAGPVALLGRGGLGVVGSRDLDSAAEAFASGVAAQAAATGEVVVSGGGRGAGRVALDAALATGGEGVGVLADALVRTANDAGVRRAVADGSLCLVTPYAPSAPFSDSNAMARNKVIYALADRTVVVACVEGEGSTWAGAVEALDGGFGRVLVRTGEGAPPGNRALVERGAEPWAAAGGAAPTQDPLAKVDAGTDGDVRPGDPSPDQGSSAPPLPGPSAQLSLDL